MFVKFILIILGKYSIIPIYYYSMYKGIEMRLKENLVLREIAGSWIIVPVGEMVVEFNGLMNVSESGALLWRRLVDGSTEDELVDVLLNEYSVDKETAKTDVEEFISQLREKGLLCQ